MTTLQSSKISFKAWTGYLLLGSSVLVFSLVFFWLVLATSTWGRGWTCWFDHLKHRLQGFCDRLGESLLKLLLVLSRLLPFPSSFFSIGFPLPSQFLLDVLAMLFHGFKNRLRKWAEICHGWSCLRGCRCHEFRWGRGSWFFMMWFLSCFCLRLLSCLRCWWCGLGYSLFLQRGWLSMYLFWLRSLHGFLRLFHGPLSCSWWCLACFRSVRRQVWCKIKSACVHFGQLNSRSHLEVPFEDVHIHPRSLA